MNETSPAQQTTLANLRNAPPANLPDVSIGLTSSQGFELAQRAAKMLASSSLVPKEYQGNLSNCIIALNMAARIGADPLMVMQNLVIVHGKPTWSSQFLIATVNTCGRFSALRYEFFGEEGQDTWGCRAWAIEKHTGEKLVGTDVTIAIAKKEGWYGKNGSKWQSIPQQMLMYRAGSWWARAYAPELSMGLHTSDEIADVIDMNPDGTFAVTTEQLRGDAMKNATPANDAGPSEPVTGPQAENPGPDLSKELFDFSTQNLKTQAGIKAAINGLAALLASVAPEDRQLIFSDNGGKDIVSAASRAGIGSQREKFIELGINLNPAEAA